MGNCCVAQPQQNELKIDKEDQNPSNNMQANVQAQTASSARDIDLASVDHRAIKAYLNDLYDTAALQQDTVQIK